MDALKLFPNRGSEIGIFIKTYNEESSNILDFGAKSFNQLDSYTYIPYGYEELESADFRVVSVPFTLLVYPGIPFTSMKITNSMKIPKNQNCKLLAFIFQTIYIKYKIYIYIY
jgi:hypothetical protein